MKVPKIILILTMVLMLWLPAISFNSGIQESMTINQYFAENVLSLDNNLDANAAMNDMDDLELKKDIYE